jgi:hypothetical protein
MHPFGPEAEHRLVEALLAVREAIVDALVWFGDMCMALFDWLAQGQVGTDKPSPVLLIICT